MPADFFTNNTLHTNTDAEGELSAVVDASNMTLEAGGIWTLNELANWGITLISGTFVGESRKIASNTTGGAIVLVTAFSGTPSVSDTYEITFGTDYNTGASRTQGAGTTGPKVGFQAGWDALSNGESLGVQAGRDYEVFTGTHVVTTASGGTSALQKTAYGYLVTDEDYAANAVISGRSGATGTFQFTGTAANAIFRNITFKESDEEGFEDAGADEIGFIDCIFEGNTKAGIDLDNLIKCDGCISRNNGGDGFNMDFGGHLVDCISQGNTGDGVDMSSSDTGDLVENCLIYENGGVGIRGLIRGTVHGCTIADNTGDGIDSTSSAALVLVKNCIIANNGGFGLKCVAGEETSKFERNNCLFGNVSGARSNWLAGPGTITTDPEFVDPASDDYTKKLSSPCVAAGFDLRASHLLNKPATRDIGMTQSVRQTILAS